MPNETIAIQSDTIRLECLADTLRIVRLEAFGQPSVLATLDEQASVETPWGRFFFIGGHRLWHAPEALPRTYVPDQGVARLVEQTPHTLAYEQPADPFTHVAKAWRIALDPDAPRVVIQHTLRNEGAWSITLAPWAITMLRLGGVAILPQPLTPSDEAALLPNRHLALWPYASINDARLHLGDDAVLVKAEPALPPLKLGYANPHGWLAYWWRGLLFIKHFEVDGSPTAAYPDLGCNAELYCNDAIVELESLAPLTRLAPGESVQHTETWVLAQSLDALPDGWGARVAERVRSLAG